MNHTTVIAQYLLVCFECSQRSSTIELRTLFIRQSMEIPKIGFPCHFSMNVFVFGPVLISFDPTVVVQTQDAAIRFLKAVGVDFERHKVEGMEGKLLGALLKGSASWPYEGIGGKGMNIELC